MAAKKNFYQRQGKKPVKTRNIFVGPGQGLAGRRKAMLEQFKAFNVETADNLDELVSMSAFGRTLKAEFESQSIAVPEYVNDSMSAIKREIERRVADRRAARVRELRAQEASLQTAAEKREAIKRELAALGEAV
jgi:hypothetical protein